MPEKKGLLSRLFSAPTEKKPAAKKPAAKKPAPKPVAKKPAAKSPTAKVAPKSAPKLAPKPAAKPPVKAAPTIVKSTLVAPKPSAGKPGVNLGAPKMAPSRPANRPQVKPGAPLPPKGATQASGASIGGPSRPANRQAKPSSKSSTATEAPRPAVRLVPRPRPEGIGPRRIATSFESATGKRTIRELDARGQRVLLRVDFNVPLSDGKVVDDSRIRASIPTIKALLEDGASIVLASHLGRPDGKVVDGLRLRPAAERLAHHLKMMVPTTGDALGVGTDDAVNRLRPGELLLLENVRFHAGEEKNDPAFAARLASYGDVFVNDAFGTAHRAHASTVGVAGLLPSYVGLLMESEVEALSNLLDKPARPFAAIVGGGKV